MSDSELLRLSAQIVSAHARHNKVQSEQLISVIQTVYEALQRAGETTEIEPVQLEPAVPIKKSVFPEYIVCLEDGKKLKMIKRHLKTAYGMTPAQYRAKWKLPSNYPMVAPDYAEKRSILAKQTGLGRLPTTKVEIKRIPEGRRGKRTPKVPHANEAGENAAAGSD
jgi:predicted transcriptional regulator